MYSKYHELTEWLCEILTSWDVAFDGNWVTCIIMTGKFGS